ncbi:hypothetical protein BC940DRAFT_328464 [Gongronella butleri]|nr:hypothetical protein BC940DRAFT_328464 [Gongronella butleri]
MIPENLIVRQLLKPPANRIEPGAAQAQLTPHHRLPYCLVLPCIAFAKEFIIITTSSLIPVLERTNLPLPPLGALAHFIIANKTFILDIERSDDETIQRLFALALQKFGKSPRAITDDVSAVESAIGVFEQARRLFEKVQLNNKKPELAKVHAENGAQFCQKMKQRFQDAM